MEAVFLEPPIRTTHTDLELTLFGRIEGGYTGYLTYATALFEPATATRILALFQTLVTALADATPDTPLSALPTMTEADFFPALWGCLLAGAVPVAVAQPRRASMSDAVFAKLVGAWTLLRHPLIVCEAETLAVLDAGREVFGEQDPKAIRVETLQAHPPLPGPVASNPEALALMQLTSGSTGMAKGVQIRQKGVATHVSLVRQANGYTADWKSLNWLPYDHVGALLTYHLTDSWLGCNQVVVATDLVLKDPGLWLDLIEAHRATRSWSPNFGFKLVLNHAARHPEKRWDLSSLRFLMNGGEQVTPSVLRDFEEVLIRNGAHAGVMQPAFGMAESCSTVSYENAFSAATGVQAYDKGILETGEATGEVIELVSLGAVVPGCSLKIVDAQGRPLPERRIGPFPDPRRRGHSRVLRQPGGDIRLPCGRRLARADSDHSGS